MRVCVRVCTGDPSAANRGRLARSAGSKDKDEENKNNNNNVVRGRQPDYWQKQNDYILHTIPAELLLLSEGSMM